MKIIGGNFGSSGTAFIRPGSGLVLVGAREAIYTGEQINSINANQIENRKFGVLGFLVGGVLLAWLIGMFLGLIGILIGIAVAIAGSFYSETSHQVQIEFADGNQVTLDCSGRSVRQLYGLQA
ncbi:MAG TPA: hypothetical protein PK725_12615 [Rhodocyclaceae bacterium]|nr:hypothetical protein [Rhodocyclaceae bacterium]